MRQDGWWGGLWRWVKLNLIWVIGVLVLIVGASLLLAYTRPSASTVASAVWALTGDVERTLTIRDARERTKELTIILASGLEEFESRIWLRNFGRHLALALLVSAFLIAVVEVHTRWRATQEVGRDVLYAILGKVVPPGVFQEVNDLILKSPYLRKNLTYTFHFTDAGLELGPDFNQYVFILTVMSWRVHNLSGLEGQPYDVHIIANDTPLIKQAEEVFAPRFLSLTINDAQIPLQDVLSENGMILRHRLNLPRSSAESLRVRVEMREVGFKRERAFWGNYTVTEGLHVQWSSAINGLKFDPFLPHPRGGEFRLDPDVQNKKTYPGILLPGQVLAMQWEIEQS